MSSSIIGNSSGSPGSASNVATVGVGGNANGNVQVSHAEPNDLLAKLKSLDLEPGNAEIFCKQDAKRGTLMAGDRQADLLTNVFVLGTNNKNVLIHQYAAEFSKTLARPRNGVQTFPLVQAEKFNRKVPDHTAYQNRFMHQNLLVAFIEKYPNVFGKNADNFCYDYATTLFSLNELADHDTLMVLTQEETQQAIQRPYKVNLVLKRKSEKSFQVGDWKKNVENGLAEQPSEIIRFFELATSRYASQHPEDHVMYESKNTFYMFPGKFGLNSPDLGSGKYLAAGASKVVSCVEGARNEGVPAVIIDSKKTPFYQTMNLLDMVCSGLQVGPNVSPNRVQWEMAEKYVRRLECFPLYGNRQNSTILLRTLSNANALETMMELNGNQISISQYFQQRYQIILKFPHWPLATGAKKVNGNSVYFPLELLLVADYQRVNNGNITSGDIASIVKACAVNPSVKSGEIMGCHKSFAFGADEFTQRSQMAVSDHPMAVQGRILKAPSITYANGTLDPEQNGKWRLPKTAKYLRCASVKSWCALFLIVPGERMNLGEYQLFVQKFYEECRFRGINLGYPVQIWDVRCDAQAIEEAFENASQAKCEFILVGHSDRDNTMHSYIKGMELKYSLISQCVKTKTINNVMKKSPLSLENIVAKTNVKLGGINYNVVLNNYPIDPTVLFIGLGMNHPAGGMAAPPVVESSSNANVTGSDVAMPQNVSVLGFSANDGIHPNEFIGNFFFQPVYRDENIGILDTLLVEILERFQANRKCPPSRVIFYRSGCSEGSYGSVLRYEIPVITAIVNKFAPGAPITLILPSKTHSVRFFKTNINPANRSDDQNIRPGTCVDGTVVSNAYCEFFLNSHLAIQGTAKTPKFTILYTSEANATLDMFERWTNALCYAFQIVTSPTSLPAPVYIANRYAERGRQIYNAFPSSSKLNRSSGHESNGDGNNGNGGASGSEFYAGSLRYNYSNSGFLRDKRINA